jgi:hypothetical protein
MRAACPPAHAGHQPGSAQHAQVLGCQRLGNPERIDQLMDAARPFGQLKHDGQPVRRPERTQQLAGRIKVAGPVLDRRWRAAPRHHMNILTELHLIKVSGRLYQSENHCSETITGAEPIDRRQRGHNPGGGRE